jgi:hypothetical protein
MRAATAGHDGSRRSGLWPFFQALLDANARTLNAKIISNAAFSYLCFPAHVLRMAMD